MVGGRAVPQGTAVPLPAGRPAPSHEPTPRRKDRIADGDDAPGAARDLLLHRLDPATGDCTACGQPCPCPHANAAAWVLAQAGHWDQPPPCPTPDTRQARPRLPWRALARALQRRRRPTA
jgi:hypothetical protein